MTLEKFSKQLSALIPATGVRPFVCDGSPLACRAFVIGLNPASQGEFWPYWDNGYGFDKPRWFVDYQQSRQQCGKRPVSPTRRVIERVATAALPIRCLETNIYAVPSTSISKLNSSARDIAPIEFLLNTIKPKALVLHGNDVAMQLGQILKATGFATTDFRDVVVPWGTVKVMAVAHFSRGWSNDKADELGRKLLHVLTD